MPSTEIRKAHSRLQEARGRLRLGDVFSTSLSVYITNFARFTLIALIVYCPLLLLDEEGALGSWLVPVLAFLKQQLLMAAVIFGVYRQLEEKSASIHDCIAVAVRRLIPLLGSLIHIGIVCSIVGVCPLIVALFVGHLFRESPGWSVLFFFLGLLPTVAVYCVMFAAPPAVVAQKISVTDAYHRSIRLTKGNRLRLFAILLTNLVLMFFVVSFSLFVIGRWRDHLGPFGFVADLAHLLLRLGIHTFMAVTIAVVYFRLEELAAGDKLADAESSFDQSSTGE